MPKKNEGHQKKVAQIKNYIKRRQRAGHGTDAHMRELGRLIELQGAKSGDSQIDRAAMEYIVVKVVATLQSTFKDVLRLAVDSMNTSGESIPDFDIKLSIPMVQDLIKRDFSIGDFVSSLVPLNSYHEMINAFEQVTGRKFLEVLKAAQEIERFGHFENGFNKEAVDMIYKDLNDLFEHRNIICHELTEKTLITERNLDDWTYVAIPVIQTLEYYEREITPPSIRHRN